MRFVPFVLIFIVFYFLLFKPQNDKIKKLQDVQSKLKKGDKVLLASGIIGTIKKVISEHEISVEIAEKVHITCLKSSVSEKIK